MSDSKAFLVITILNLMIRYHTIKRTLDRSWVFHIKGFSAVQSEFMRLPETRNLSVRITYESILKFVPVLRDGELPNDGISIDYLLDLDNHREIRDFGCSPELLHLLGCINIADYRSKDQSQRLDSSKLLLARCDGIAQTTPELEPNKREAIENTAESYIHMARILIYWRLLGYRSFNSTILVQLGNILARCVRGVPTTNGLFTAQYPLAPAFWAMIFSADDGRKIYEFLKTTWEDRPTVSP